MDFKQVVRYLVDEGYMIVMDGVPILTIAFGDEFRKTRNDLPKKPESVKSAIPAKLTEEQKKLLWLDFVIKAEIPHRIRTDNGNYTVRHFSKDAANALIKILDSFATPEDEQLFIDATKNYYKTVSHPQGLGKYLSDGTWMMEMNEWKKNKGRIEASGVNKFES